MIRTMVIASLLAFNYAQAMDGTFDRSGEVDQYVEKITVSKPEALIATAKEIYVSGLGDERLAQAISNRLLQDLPTLKSAGNDGTQYGAWMVKALASTGTPLAKTTIAQVRTSTNIYRIKTECDEQIREVDWQNRKNALMASKENYHEGDSMRVAQLLNLLRSNDYSFKQDAAYRMSWDRNLDAKLMEEIAAQLQTFATKNGISNDKAEIVVMSHYAKMLGYSGNTAYGPLLVNVYNSKANKMVTKHARLALERLNVKFEKHA